MQIAFYTLGCKVNLFETQALSQMAVARGHTIVEHHADAVIVNTCTVTSISDHKNIRAIHKLRRDNPTAILVACGCLAETNPEKLQALPEVDFVFGTRNRAQVLAVCEAAVAGHPLPSLSAASQPADYTDHTDHTNQADPANPTSNTPWVFESLPAGVPAGRTRALLKIEDGCDNYCAYCIIPYARGAARSMPLSEVFEQTKRLEQAAVHEVVLTGIELASYGREWGITLVDLLEQLLPYFPRLRFRLGSLDPRIAGADFCQRLQGFPNLALHFHLSLQSGCDTVLQRMGRRYTTSLYYQNVCRLRETFPDCSITTDVIVGFPGETEAEFTQTLAFLQQCAFAAVHVFPYSPRKGTRAATMPHPLSQKVKESRATRTRQVAQALSEQYRKPFLGRVLSALPEHPIQGFTQNLWMAHSSFGFPVYVEGADIQKNIPEQVRLVALYRDGIRAEKLSVPAATVDQPNQSNQSDQSDSSD